MPDVPWPASRRQIDLAGERVRNWWVMTDPGSSELLHTDGELNAAARLAWDYRDGFSTPLNSITMGLRYMVLREAETVVVSQRLKRMPTIVDKLARFPTMKLSRMEDIGGCRAILRNQLEVDRVLRRIRRRWEIHRFRDYVACPKDTGYRAIHVVARRHGRLIEVQLRTPFQQFWATEVDRIASVLGTHVKDGYGPEELVRFLQILADRMAFVETSGSVAGFPREEEFQSLWPNVYTYFRNP